MSTQNHIFSSGVLRVGAPGATPLATDGTTTVGNVENISVAVSFDRKEVNEAAQVSRFAVDNADSGGKASLKMSNKDFNRILLPYLAGMAKTTGGSVDTFTLSATSVPQACRVEIDCQDSAGKNVKVVAQEAKGKGVDLGAKIQDFADNSFEFDVYPDASNNILTIAMDQ
jgi:hypothetical protein